MWETKRPSVGRSFKARHPTPIDAEGWVSRYGGSAEVSEVAEVAEVVSLFVGGDPWIRGNHDELAREVQAGEWIRVEDVAPTAPAPNTDASGPASGRTSECR